MIALEISALEMETNALKMKVDALEMEITDKRKTSFVLFALQFESSKILTSYY